MNRTIPSNPTAPFDLDQVLAFTAARREEDLRELFELLRIPSIGTQVEHRADTARAAEWLAGRLAAAGLENVKTIATPGNPLVYADWLHAGPAAPTVLIYGHYDVQPPDPLELWNSAPFEPEIRDGYLYARGAADDKGQLYIHVKAAAAYLQTAGRLPVNVKFLFEGEEESGSANILAFLPDNSALLAADLGLISDTDMVAPDRPALVRALRGMCYTYLDVYGPDKDLHSGSYGGGVDNPLNVISHLISRLKDADGRVLIPGFYDRVRPLTAAERADLAAQPVDEAQWLAETGTRPAWGEPGYTMAERLGTRPTLDVNGLVGGYTGAGAKTVIPAHAHAKISMRLVPDQYPDEIYELYARYVREIAPPTVRVETTYVHKAQPTILSTDHPATAAAARAYRDVFDREPVFLYVGGSIPIVSEFQRVLGIESVMMGFGLPDDNIHSPNERFWVANFHRGIETAIRFLDYLGRSPGSA